MKNAPITTIIPTTAISISGAAIIPINRKLGFLLLGRGGAGGRCCGTGGCIGVACCCESGVPGTGISGTDIPGTVGVSRRVAGRWRVGATRFWLMVGAAFRCKERVGGAFRAISLRRSYRSKDASHSMPVLPTLLYCATPLLCALAPRLGYAAMTPKCYIDDIDSYSTNEVTINWNAPLAWVVTYLDAQFGE
jgi:hypothetical protein